MSRLDDVRDRSKLIANSIAQKTDITLFELIDEYENPLDFRPINEFSISSGAWNHVSTLAVKPQLVFAHPELLGRYPQASKYYRGIGLLSQKQVSQLATSIVKWEDGSNKRNPGPIQVRDVAKLYNDIISSLIDDADHWSLEDGLRNIIATTGIGLDGTARNVIGRSAEKLVKSRLLNWLQDSELITVSYTEGRYVLENGVEMRFGSEPDIEFVRFGQLVATVEIKGGKDPAGALERLGAMQKSFAETPPGCVNFLVAGVVTSEMEKRLNQIGVVKVYLLDQIVADEEHWNDFALELFHHALRIS